MDGGKSPKGASAGIRFQRWEEPSAAGAQAPQGASTAQLDQPLPARGVAEGGIWGSPHAVSSLKALSGAGKERGWNAGRGGAALPHRKADSPALLECPRKVWLANPSFPKTSIKGQLQSEAQAANNLGTSQARLSAYTRAGKPGRTRSSTDSQESLESMEAASQERATCSCCIARTERGANNTGECP